TFPGTKVPPPVQVVAVEKSVQTPAADLQHPGTLHVSPPTQAGSSSILTTFSPQPATDRIVHSLGVRVLPSCPLLHCPGLPSPPKTQIQLMRPVGSPPSSEPPRQISPGGAVSTSTQPWPTAPPEPSP